MRITTNLPVTDIETAKGFYTDYLGLRTEEFNLGWVARFTDTDTGAHVQLVTGDLTSPEARRARSTRMTSTRPTRGAGAWLRDRTPADPRGRGGPP